MSPVANSFYCHVGGEQRLESCIQKLVEKGASAVGLQYSKTLFLPQYGGAHFRHACFGQIKLQIKQNLR